MNEQAALCRQCDHQIVPGVACDGPGCDCPHPSCRRLVAHRLTRYVTLLDSLTGRREYDAVRGEA